VKYVLIALSLLLIGSIADVPVMFLAVDGSLSLWFVCIAGFLADILPDFFWYWLGQRIGVEGFCKLPIFRQRPEHLEAIGRTLDRFGGLLLFGSKFIYAFGIPTQVMAGAHHFPLKRAVVANALGSAGWLVLLYALAHIFTSSDIAEAHLKSARLDFTLFIIFGIIVYFLIGLVAKRFLDRKDA
jgi:membrane protein DedA with SNARE-associated domain